MDNIQLPPALLSRFDLIYLILDAPDKAKDRRLARHMVSLYYADAVAPTREGEMVLILLIFLYEILYQCWLCTLFWKLRTYINLVIFVIFYYCLFIIIIIIIIILMK